MINTPYVMYWHSASWKNPIKVHVYDFMHETIETFQSCALCWVPSKEAWATIPVYELVPEKTSKKLNEGDKKHE